MMPPPDASFRDPPTAHWLRGRTHARLNTRFRLNDHVLELGCGPGMDARHLAAQGVRVTATDADPAVLALAAQHARQAPLADFHPLDLHALPADEFRGPYDGAFANFGVLNALPEWTPLAGWLAARVRPGGWVLLGVMGRLCAWETLWYAAHLDLRQAGRRLRGRAFSETDAAWTYYPTARRLTRDFAPYFRRRHIQAIGLFVPPHTLYTVTQQRPRLERRLRALENRLGDLPDLARFADYYWVEFQRLR